MSCDNVQELISPLIDRQIPAGERETVLAHLKSCRQCGAHFEAIQNLRSAMGEMNRAPMPADLSSSLRVMASHERARQVSRASVSSRVRYWTDRAQLWFDNLMRPVAVPFAGGLLSAVVLFSALVPSLTIQHEFADSGLYNTDPYGQVVVLDSTGAYASGGSADLPRIEPTYAENPDDANVVWLAINENGKVQDYKVAKGRLTSDMQNIIMISKFSPATFLGLPTPGLIKMVQRSSRRSLRS
jgi:hypothetical protein